MCRNVVIFIAGPVSTCGCSSRVTLWSAPSASLASALKLSSLSTPERTMRIQGRSNRSLVFRTDQQARAPSLSQTGSDRACSAVAATIWEALSWVSVSFRHYSHSISLGTISLGTTTARDVKMLRLVVSSKCSTSWASFSCSCSSVSFPSAATSF